MIPDKHLQVMAHLYRGEMNRLTVYRQRLDSTLQYSITITSVMMIYYFSYPHILIPIVNALFIFIFCFIETRRYRYFILSHDRIKKLEEGFFCQQVLHEEGEYGWRTELSGMLRRPVFPKSFVYCWSIRYCRNYIWLIDIILLCLWGETRNNLLWFGALQHTLLFYYMKQPDLESI